MSGRGVALSALVLLGVPLAGAGSLESRAQTVAPSPREETRGGILWKFDEGDRARVERLQSKMARFHFERTAAGLPLSVVVFPEIGQMAEADSDSRYATFRSSARGVVVHVAADAPDQPDLVSPIFAAAVHLARHPTAGKQPVLLAGNGARRAGFWWGRTPSQWGALLTVAGLWRPVEDLCGGAGREASDLLLVGEAAAVLEGWAAVEGEERVDQALAAGNVNPSRLAEARERAARIPAGEQPRRPLPRAFLRGVSFAMANRTEESYLSRGSEGTLDHLRSDWVSAISVLPYAFQRRASSPEIRFAGHDPREETEEAVLRVVLAARARGMTVLVKPQIWLWRGFTGDIAMPTDEAWRAWFRNYLRFLLRFAVVAEAGRADLFDIGVELGGSERRQEDWRFLISAIRAATAAPLLYSCNWGRGAAAVPFWDLLDGIGVDFYDPLSASWTAGDGELARGARAAARPLELLAQRMAKPVFLTEVGFPSIAAAWVAPSDESAPRPFSDRDSARAARAIFEVFGSATWCRGLFWWKAFSNGQPAERDEKTFNILGRPIERTIREEFQAIAEREGLVAAPN